MSSKGRKTLRKSNEEDLLALLDVLDVLDVKDGGGVEDDSEGVLA